MKKHVQNLQEFKSYMQSMDYGFVLENNNDSDMSTIMENSISKSIFNAK